MRRVVIASGWSARADVSLHRGDTLELLRRMPDAVAQLVITSPPYNIGKAYERRRSLDEYLAEQAPVIAECVRILRPGGSLCWQVGNDVRANRVTPLDLLLYPLFAGHEALRLRNRIVWHFAHGLHCRRRFSGRYEVILWYTRGPFHARLPGYFCGTRIGSTSNA